MKLTNKHGLPEPILKAWEVIRTSYSRGESDISCTQIVDSPQIRLLREKHKDEIEVDIMDQIWSLLGSSLHHLLELSGKTLDQTLSEKRMYAKVGPYTISAQLDHLTLDGGVLTDYKMTSVWSAIYGKKDYERILNIQKWILEQNGIMVSKLQNCLFLRDWVMSRREENNYPKTQATIINQPVWTNEEAEKYIKSRVWWHLNDKPKTCSQEERWAKPDKFAVMGAKKAIRLLDSREEAEKWAYDNTIPNPVIEYRQGDQWKRCREYCDVSKFCPQFSKSKAKP